MKAAAWAAAALLASLPALAAEARPGLAPCRLSGVEHQALCGSVRRPLDPAVPAGVQIDIHFAVLPALARNRHADPVFVFAGGPGQSAIDVAGLMGRTLARLNNRRDIVLVDQRGTGRSAPLRCTEPAPTDPIARWAGSAAQVGRLAECRSVLQALPHGRLGHYTTWIASQDADAVRVALGAAQINAVGASYGTRAALDYQRQFPQAVRRAVLDGVAPPDMVLPSAFSSDSEAALEAVFAACAADAACSARQPDLRDSVQRLLAGLPQRVELHHPITGRREALTLTRDIALSWLRVPLYAPALASALPLALADAVEGRFDALAALAATLSAGRGARLAEGLHFSVVCAEDLPRPDAALQPPGPLFGDAFATLYRRVCAEWPRGAVPDAFYFLPPAGQATLLLSGGADPATPPRHGERVARQLGAKAKHLVVPNAGHGVMALPCLRDVLFRFVDAADDTAALAVDAGCAAALPRPPVLAPLAASGAAR